jgi:predicted NBD/HSP70 family sugar kinase
MPPFDLPRVHVSGYSAELFRRAGASPSGREYVGDQARGEALIDTFAEKAATAKMRGDDEEAENITEDVSYSDLDGMLRSEAGLEQTLARETADGFADRLVAVISHFLQYRYWRDTERIVIGGGLTASRIGAVVIANTAAKLRALRSDLQVTRIHHDADDAGLVGCVHLLAAEETHGHDTLLAVDIGGTKVRVGTVHLNSEGLGHDAAYVGRSTVWKHAGEGLGREEVIGRIADMILEHAAAAEEEGRRVMPSVCIGVPGVIDEDGCILRGAQNLPGDWEDQDFRLSRVMADALASRSGKRMRVVACNDAVVQGLSELPFMSDVTRWGIFTVGTGLGNAHFVNRETGKGGSGA